MCVECRVCWSRERWGWYSDNSALLYKTWRVCALKPKKLRSSGNSCQNFVIQGACQALFPSVTTALPLRNPFRSYSMISIFPKISAAPQHSQYWPDLRHIVIVSHPLSIAHNGVAPAKRVPKLFTNLSFPQRFYSPIGQCSANSCQNLAIQSRRVSHPLSIGNHGVAPAEPVPELFTDRPTAQPVPGRISPSRKRSRPLFIAHNDAAPPGCVPMLCTLLSFPQKHYSWLHSTANYCQIPPIFFFQK